MERKFKVWDKVEKKWIDDSDIAINQQGLLFIRYECQVEFQPMSLTKSANYEIVFFTGLKDKKGKEICEGDVVKVYNKYEERFKNLVVEMDEWSRWNVYDRGCRECELYVTTMVGNIEIIGNKFENGELLK